MEKQELSHNFLFSGWGSRLFLLWSQMEASGSEPDTWMKAALKNREESQAARAASAQGKKGRGGVGPAQEKEGLQAARATSAQGKNRVERGGGEGSDRLKKRRNNGRPRPPQTG